jgi:hypothetical protein
MGFAIGGAALAAAYMSSQASEDAANTQADAANNASRLSDAQYQQNRQDMMPWLDSGRNALSQLNQQMPNLTRSFSAADFQQDPGYQFNLQQGQQAIERSAAARGGLNSGATEKSLAQYSQGLAGQQYQNAFNNFNTNQSNTFNRLAGMAGVGQQAATTVGQMGQQNAANIGQNMMGAANAQAAGQVAGANAINSAVGVGANSWMQSQMLDRLAPVQQQPGSFNMNGNYSGGFGASSTSGYQNALGTYNFNGTGTGG